MHPNPRYRTDDRALMETLIDEIGFGMVFAQTPDGPRVAHTPLLSTGDGAVQFHLARGNALARHLAGSQALVVINGPDGYVSPRWYADRDRVPTWNYVALELEGRVRRMESEGLKALLDELIARHEKRLGESDSQPGWSAQDISAEHWHRLMKQIVGFELEILAWRPTLKLSQESAAAEREAVARGLENSGSSAIAQLMRGLVR